MPVSDDLLVGSDGEWVTVMHGRVMLARFPAGDLGMRNLAVVSLTNTRLGCKEVADAFDLSATYVSVLRRRVRDEGSAGLSRDMGRPVAIDAAGEATAVRMRASGKTHAEIGACLDVDPTTVGRLLGRLAAAPVQPDQLPLVDPDLDTEDNDNDGDGDTEDNDSDADGAGGRPGGVRPCRYAGAALLFAFMERVGFDKVFKMRTPAGYRYDSTAVLAGTAAGFLLGAGNIEGFKHLNRVDLGALVGLDRFPTTRTLRGRLGEIGDTVNAVDLQARLAKALLDFDGPQFDLFFVDDHFVTYSGAAPLAKGWNNRKGRAEHGRDDTWVTDSAGRPLVCVSGEPSGLTRGLKAIIGPLRKVVGVDARPLLAFDRGGSYPTTFTALNAAGWDWVAYRRAPLAATATTARVSWFEMDGVRHTYRCADEIIDLKDYGPARQITIFEAGVAAAQILTSVTSGVNARIIHLLRCRWRIENAFKYLADNHGINWLCDYAKTDKTITIEVPNPERAAANRAVADAVKNLAVTKARLGDITNRDRVTDVKAQIADIGTGRDNITYAQDDLAAAKAHRKTVPAKLHPHVPRAEPRLERRALQTALRICAHNAEHWLARQLDIHLQNPDEVRSHTRALMHQPGTITYHHNRITITIDPPDEPRVAHAVHALLQQLNQKPAHIPGDPRPVTYTLNPRP